MSGDSDGYTKYILDISNDSELDDDEFSGMVVAPLRAISGVDAAITRMDETMLDHLKQAQELAEYGSEEKRFLTEAWNEIAEHQKETGEWYDE